MNDILKDATARPWQTLHDFNIEGKCKIIANLDGEIHGDGTTSHTYDAVAICSDEFGEQMNPANARLIVTAVNAYEPMLEALEGLVAGI